jgi:hypothetical protein
MVLGSEETRKTVQGNLAYLNRQTYSFPPYHGQALVTRVLTDPALRAEWEAELEEVRTGMLDLRKQLADELRKLSNSDRFDFVAEHRGMFSRLGASPWWAIRASTLPASTPRRFRFWRKRSSTRASEPRAAALFSSRWRPFEVAIFF